MIYPLIRNFLFCFPPEDVHYFSMKMLKLGCTIKPIEALLNRSFYYAGTDLEKTVFGLSFRNPVGLGAGFDKNANYLTELAALGFGFVEIGTVTPKAQPGNDKPRLFRLPADKALINRMGFNNDGAEAIKARLTQWQNVQHSIPKTNLIIGGNIGKNKITPNKDAWKDYLSCFHTLFDCVDYFVVNVSSPNTPGLRELQEKEFLKKILTELQNVNQSKTKTKPILLKIAPDLSEEQLAAIVDLSFEVALSGLVATNTTISRDGLSEHSIVKSQKIGAGGLSGLPVKKKATDIVHYLSKATKGQIPIIASGGILNGADADEKIAAGASLIQVWTGFVYEGPSITKKICSHLSNQILDL